MEVPSFADLGQCAREVFKNGYHYGKGLVKMNVRTKSAGSFELGSDLAVNFDASKLHGLIETKYKTKEYGSLWEKWNTDGILFAGYKLDANLTGGVALESEMSYNPETSLKGFKIGTKYANDKFNTALAISHEMNADVSILGSLVVAFRDIFLGYQGGYNTTTNKVTKNDVGVAFGYQEVGVHFRCTSIPNEFGLSLMYKAQPDLDVALNGMYARTGSQEDWTLGAAARWKLDENSTIRCKFNTDLQLGTSLQQKLNENMALTLSFNVDCANVTGGGHKVGLALDLTA